MTTLTQLEEGRNTTAKQAFSDTTAEFLKWMQGALKARGWVRTDARLQSALYHWTFEKGERKINITGWHGTGKRGTSRWYGDLKTLFTLYDNRSPARPDPADRRMLEVINLSCIDGTVEQHAKQLEAIRAYIRASA